jgi:hypothetical protein
MASGRLEDIAHHLKVAGALSYCHGDDVTQLANRVALRQLSRDNRRPLALRRRGIGVIIEEKAADSGRRH